MKKLAVFATLTALLVSGCGPRYYAVLIKNGSPNKTVLYYYNGINDTLAPNASKNYEVLAYTMAPANYREQNGIASIEMKRSGDTFTFKEAEKMELNILNTLPVGVKRIKADDYISYNDNSFLVDVPEGETISSGLYIYTNKPNFSLEADSNGIIEPSYPITFDWKIIDNKMFVTIR